MNAFRIAARVVSALGDDEIPDVSSGMDDNKGTAGGEDWHGSSKYLYFTSHSGNSIWGLPDGFDETLIKKAVHQYNTVKAWTARGSDGSVALRTVTDMQVDLQENNDVNSIEDAVEQGIIEASYACDDTQHALDVLSGTIDAFTGLDEDGN